MYSDAFYAKRDVAPSARAILGFVLGVVEAQSVVDLGCGDGGWLAAAQEKGVEEILGFDGPWVPQTRLRIPQESFIAASLTASPPLPHRFDLAISLEVAEHLPASRAAGFVHDLACAADVVLFSAAVPGQGGTGHINEQWPAYWTELFAREGYRPIDAVRPRFWDQEDIRWWYRQNVLLFANAAGLARWPKLAALAAQLPDASARALIHPALYERKHANLLLQFRARLRAWKAGRAAARVLTAPSGGSRR
jgi:SAM-dependent methyltransferase